MRDPRQDYIRLLQRSVDHFTPKPGEERDAVLVGELAEAGYLKGRAAADASGVTRGAVSWGVTVEGRLFLRRLEKEVREESFWARTKRWGFPLLTYVAGVATPVLSDWLKTVFHVKP